MRLLPIISIRRNELRSIWHYLIIYFMLVLNQSVIRMVYLADIYVLITGILLTISILKERYRPVYTSFFLVILLTGVMLSSVFIGGVGILRWVLWAQYILIALYAIQFDIEYFLERYVKLVVFMAIISLVCFFLYYIAPDVLNKLLLPEYNMKAYYKIWKSGTEYELMPYKARGLFMYVINGSQNGGRNCGIYTEPGVYQMVLNAALVIVLFFRKYIRLTDKQATWAFISLSITILTVQSTTGYIGMIMCFLVYMLTPVKGKSLFKGKVILITSIALVSFILILWFSGNDNIFEKVVVKKIVNDSGELDLSVGTGSARVGTILLGISTMLKNPLGVGYDRVQLLLDTDNTNFLAAQVFQDGMALGLFTFLIIVWWITFPIIKSKIGIGTKFILIFLYWNTALAQSNTFYPVLIIFSIYFGIKMFRKRIILS